jgi:hypothetical protein
MGMTKKLFFWRRKFYPLAAIFLFPLLLASLFGSGYSAARKENSRVDMLTLEAPSAKTDGKMHAVTFFHDKHTRALSDKGCQACHDKISDKGQPEIFNFEFKNTGDLDSKAAMEKYHAECAGCHQVIRNKGEKSGPLTGECRACHQRTPEISSAWQRIPFSKSLHFRHTETDEIRFKPQTYENNCGACHHEYDKKLKKTVYKKGEEGSCRYCHKDQKVQETRSYRDAAHTDCVNCHRRLAEGEKDAGPFDCAGCHSRKGQEKIKKLAEVPRMKRGQPDAVLMADWLKEAAESEELPKQWMQPVAFDHVTHEAASQTCRACHHASLEPCRKCHTIAGSADGDNVALAAAMHNPDSTRSCVGCHDEAKQHKNCAGCHTQMSARVFADRDCVQCHAVGKDRLDPLPANDEARAKIVAAAVNARADAPEGVSEAEIPEKVTVDIMADEYQGATFPHRKIVKALSEKTKTSKLAAAFHRGSSETLCMGCHHNSPPSLTPPRCVSCHNLNKEGAADGRPGLKGAYHGQCIGCHQQMKIEKPGATDCTECHKESDKTVKANSG